MNLLSEAGEAAQDDSLNMLRGSGTDVSPFVFRLLMNEDPRDMPGSAECAAGDQVADFGGLMPAAGTAGGARNGWNGRNSHDAAEREAVLQKAAEVARLEGFREGERTGRTAMRAELEVETSKWMGHERERVGAAVEQFRAAKDRYFAEVEQEVVKLALAIAARVLHREAQLDPLLLTGVVRVALEKMADRSGVVLRVAGADVASWEGALLTMQLHERPRVAEDSRLERGECVLETTMGTVELGIKVQLEEIEKGFFDLLNHRPTE
jgi:flagellar assembly protein FliH